MTNSPESRHNPALTDIQHGTAWEDLLLGRVDLHRAPAPRSRRPRPGSGGDRAYPAVGDRMATRIDDDFRAQDPTAASARPRRRRRPHRISGLLMLALAAVCHRLSPATTTRCKMRTPNNGLKRFTSNGPACLRCCCSWGHRGVDRLREGDQVRQAPPRRSATCRKCARLPPPLRGAAH